MYIGNIPQPLHLSLSCIHNTKALLKTTWRTVWNGGVNWGARTRIVYLCNYYHTSGNNKFSSPEVTWAYGNLTSFFLHYFYLHGTVVNQDIQTKNPTTQPKRQALIKGAVRILILLCLFSLKLVPVSWKTLWFFCFFNHNNLICS